MITLYSKDYCPYCVKAKNYLNSKNIEFKEVNVEHDTDAKAFLKKKGHKTVPQIYKGEELLVEGGCDGLLALPLEELLKRVNAPVGTVD